MKKTQDSHKMVKRLATAAAVWAIAKVLDLPKVARATRKVDDQITLKSGKASKSLRRATTRARQHSGLVVAGVAALAIGAGLLGRASTK